MAEALSIRRMLHINVYNASFPCWRGDGRQPMPACPGITAGQARLPFAIRLFLGVTRECNEQTGTAFIYACWDDYGILAHNGPPARSFGYHYFINRREGFSTSSPGLAEGRSKSEH